MDLRFLGKLEKLPLEQGHQNMMSPTLIVGIGGTGKEILLRVRKSLHERYDNYQSIEMVRFLWIDTDKTNQDVFSEPLQQYPLLDEILFRDDEKAIIPLASDFWHTFWQEKEQRYPHIAEWLPGSLREAGEALVSKAAGAGQIRPYGRLCFFTHFKEVQEKVFRHLAALYQDSNLQQNTLACLTKNGFTDISIDPNVQVLCICSLAGGTGSGIFLDLSFMIKDFFRQQKIDSQCMQVGFFVIPSASGSSLAGKNTLPFANTYAALAELEYYSRPSLKWVRGDAKSPQYAHFHATWDKEEGKRQLEGPAYDLSYLVSNPYKNKDEDVYDIVAEAVQLDCDPTPLRMAKHSVRMDSINYASHKYVEDIAYDEEKKMIYNRLFSRRFSSFGLSRFTVAQERLRENAAHYLGINLLKFLLQDMPQVQLTSVLNSLIKQIGLSPDIYYSQLIGDIVKKMEAEIDSAATAEEIESKIKQLRVEFKKTKYNDQIQAARQELERSIPSRILQFLDTSFQSYGSFITTKMEQELYKRFESYSQELPKKLAEIKQLVNLTREECGLYLHHQKEAEHLFLLKKQTIPYTLAKAQASVKKALQTELESLVLDHLKIPVDTTLNTLRHAPHKFANVTEIPAEASYGNLLAWLNSCLETMQKNLQTLDKPQSARHEWLLENYNYAQSVEEFLQEMGDLHQKQTLMAHFFRQYSLPQQMPLIGAMDLIARFRKEGLQKLLVKFCFQYLLKNGFKHGLKVLEVLEQTTGGSWSSKVQEVASFGEAYLGIDNFIAGNCCIKHSFCGQYPIVQGDREIKLSPSDLGDRQAVKYPGDSIVFYNEITGIPLCLLQDIDKYQKSYQEASAPLVHLNHDYRKLPSLTLLTQEEATLHSRLLKLMIQGVILYNRNPEEKSAYGKPIIYYKKDQGKVGFYTLAGQKETSEPVYLGACWAEVEENLAKSDQLQQEITNLVNLWEANLAPEEERLQYWSLLKYYRQNVFPKVNEKDKSGREIVSLQSAEHLTVASLLDSLEKEYPNKDEREKLLAPYADVKEFSALVSPDTYPDLRTLQAPFG
jgi:anion-transporting  ArsA/GET3 family ATPase